MKAEDLKKKISEAKQAVTDAQAIIDSRPAKYALGFDIPAGVVTRDYQRLHHAKNELKALEDLLAEKYPKLAPLSEKQKIRKEQRNDMLRAAQMKLEAARENVKAQEIAREARIEIEKIKAAKHSARDQELVRRLRAYIGEAEFLAIADAVNAEYD